MTAPKRRWVSIRKMAKLVWFAFQIIVILVIILVLQVGGYRILEDTPEAAIAFTISSDILGLILIFAVVQATLRANPPESSTH